VRFPAREVPKDILAVPLQKGRGRRCETRVDGGEEEKKKREKTLLAFAALSRWAGKGTTSGTVSYPGKTTLRLLNNMPEGGVEKGCGRKRGERKTNFKCIRRSDLGGPDLARQRPGHFLSFWGRQLATPGERRRRANTHGSVSEERREKGKGSLAQFDSPEKKMTQLNDIVRLIRERFLD